VAKKTDVKSVVSTLTSVSANTRGWFAQLSTEHREIVVAAKQEVLNRNLNAGAVAKNIRSYLQTHLVSSIPSVDRLAKWLRSKGE
jgi:hypothetical protein